MQKIEVVLRRRWFLILLSGILLSTALIVRLILASTVRYPGHADLAFYYTVAENVAGGRGFEIDYVWNYLSGLEDIPHYSGDYWMPLTSAIISLPLLVFGKSLFAALLPSIFAGLLISGLTYFLGQSHTGSRLAAVSAFAIVLFIPDLFVSSLLTDCGIYHALFVSTSLFLIIKAQTHPKLFLVASVCAGLAYLTRQDGVLLIPILVLVILLSPLRLVANGKYLALSLGVFLMVISPLLIANYRAFGAPFPPGPSRAMFFTEHEDLYAYSKELTLSAYWKWGGTTSFAQNYMPVS